MYCIASLPRSNSIAVYSWILESVAMKYPEYQECADLLLNIKHPGLFKEVVEVVLHGSDKYIKLNNNYSREKLKNMNNIQKMCYPSDNNIVEFLYSHFVNMYPLPIIDLKFTHQNSKFVFNDCVNNKNYSTIVLVKRDMRRQFLSLLISTESRTYHGKTEYLYTKRENLQPFRFEEYMLDKWFGWVMNLYSIKQNADYIFYMEDYLNDPGKLLRELNLPELKNYSRVVSIPEYIDYSTKILNMDEFDMAWEKYCNLYRGILE